MFHSRERGLINAYAFTLVLVASLWFWGCLLAFNALQVRDMANQITAYFAYNFVAASGLILQVYSIAIVRLNLLSLEPSQNLRLAVSQTLHIAGAVTALLVLTKDIGLSRLFFITYIGVLPILLFVANATVPRLLSRIFFSGSNQTPAILIGRADADDRSHTWLHRLESYGVMLTGYLIEDDKAPRPKSVFDVPVIGSASDLSLLLDSMKIETVILLNIPRDQKLLSTLIDASNQKGARLIVFNNLAETFQHRLRYYRQFGMDFIALRQEPLQDPMSRLLKRIFDVIVASLVVFFLLPPMALVVWLIHRLQSPGPLFYRQARAGIQNRRFEIWKFRTMHTSGGDATRQASLSDERIFPLGRLLRKMSVDEFPQFLNVLRGDMSVVGPRPHMVEHNAQFAKIMQTYHIRTFVQPGVTGLAQVRGFRGEALNSDDIRRRVECDLEYVEQWSLLWDAIIVLKTAWQIFFPPRTAY